MGWPRPKKPATEVRVQERAIGVSGVDENGSAFLDIESGGGTPLSPLSPLSPATSTRNLLDRTEGKDAPMVKPKKQPGTFRLVWRWWRAELLFSIASVFLLAMIITILRLCDGSYPIGFHLFDLLTLNGLIALLATINKACLTAPVCSAMMQEMWLYFDSEASKENPTSRLWHMDLYHQASNSSWGSLMFIRHFGRARWTTCIGCIIIVFSLAYSTFAQQLMTIASTYSQGPTTPVPYTLQFLDSSVSAPFITEFTASIYGGVLGSIPSLPSLACDTGNCTWPWTPSLGMCGGCKNSTFSAPFNCAQGLCNYTLPTGENLQMADFSQPAVPQFSTRQTFVSMVNGGNLYNSSTFDVPYITRFSMFGIPFNSSNSTVGSDMRFVHSECALWMCVNIYGTNVQSGLTSQLVIPASGDYIYYPDYPGYWQYPVPDLPGDVPTPANHSNITVYENAISQVQGLFDEILPGQVNSSVPIIQLPNGAPFEGEWYSSPLMSSIWAGGVDPQTYIDTIATSLSAVVRSANFHLQAWDPITGWRYPDPYDGQDFLLGYVVRWRWIILPIGLVFSSIAFLLLVIIRTVRNDRIASWKGSPLTLLLFDVDGSIKDDARAHVKERHGIRKAVGKTRVRFVQEEGGGKKFKVV